MIGISQNTKLEIAVEIMAAKIAKTSKEGYTINDEKMQQLIKESINFKVGTIPEMEFGTTEQRKFFKQLLSYKKAV